MLIRTDFPNGPRLISICRRARGVKGRAVLGYRIPCRRKDVNSARLYKHSRVCYDTNSPLLHADVTKAPFSPSKRGMGFWADK